MVCNLILYMLYRFEKNNDAIISYISMKHQVSIILDSQMIIL